MTDNHYEPLIGENKKSTSYKKYGAALGITGIAAAAALLLAGGSKTPVQYPTDLIEMPEDMIDTETTDLYGLSETCMTSFDRIWADNGNSIESPNFHTHLDSNGKYQDPTFPADTSSLYWSDQQGTSQYNAQVQTYKNYESQYGIAWKRPSELPGTPEPSLWGKNGVSPKVSKQGALGDCWFLSSASAIAGVPSRIHDIFANSSYATDGAFEMYFYIRGERVSVTIDDRIPVLNLGSRYTTPYPPVNNKPSPAGAWWLVLLEKAFSKLNINYTQINAGTPGEALRALTGMPVSQHNSNAMTDDELWTIVTEGTRNKNPMAAAAQVSHHNIIAGHAYGILQALCLTTNGKCVQKIIKMRNPWGKTTYDGPWNENGHRWTPEWKRQADLANTNEGEYWVPLDEWRTDYAQAFDTHYRNDWNIHTIEGNPAEFTSSRQVSGWLSFENSVTQDVVLECTQWEKRLFPPGCKNEYTPENFAFLMYDKNMTRMTTSPHMAQCNGGAINMAKLAPGGYIIRVVSFGGSDTGHSQIWKMRSFGDVAKVVLENKSNPYQ